MADGMGEMSDPLLGEPFIDLPNTTCLGVDHKWMSKPDPQLINWPPFSFLVKTESQKELQ